LRKTTQPIFTKFGESCIGFFVTCFQSRSSFFTRIMFQLRFNLHLQLRPYTCTQILSAITCPTDSPDSIHWTGLMLLNGCYFYVGFSFKFLLYLFLVRAVD